MESSFARVMTSERRVHGEVEAPLCVDVGERWLCADATVKRSHLVTSVVLLAFRTLSKRESKKRCRPSDRVSVVHKEMMLGHSSAHSSLDGNQNGTIVMCV